MAKDKSLEDRNKERIYNATYRKSKKGVVGRIYSKQLYSAKSRGHHLPVYSHQELFEWCAKQEKFHILYNEWVKSGYRKYLKPSVDRIDSLKSYTFENLQIITWKENEDKGRREMWDYYKKNGKFKNGKSRRRHWTKKGVI